MKYSFHFMKTNMKAFAYKHLTQVVLGQMVKHDNYTMKAL